MDGGSVKETPEQRALAEHASNLMADYRQRLLPVQQRMIEATKTMGLEGSSTREAATGRAAADVDNMVEGAPAPVAGAALAALVLTTMLIVVLRVQLLAAATVLVENTVQMAWMLWTLHWTIENSSPVGGLGVKIADLALIEVVRRAAARRKASTE